MSLMSRILPLTLLALSALLSADHLHAPLLAQAPAAAPDYANPASWVCRPGAEQICTAGLDTLVIAADGTKTVEKFEPAANPSIDCFYVYPTVSQEQSDFADMTDSPEIQRVTEAQAGRLTSRCRVFAPIYRQATLYQLRQRTAGGKALDFDPALADVEAAWDYYLKHDNHGRGVVLFGHSQGTILLQSLMQKSIDGTPAQSLLVSAFLAGDPSLGVPPGKTVGGTFAHIPVCSAAAQTGCVYVWGSLLASDPSPAEVFGHPRKDGQVSACVSPAAPGGGSAPLKFFHEKPRSAPAADPPWVENIGQVTGACTVTPAGDGLRVTVEPGPSAEALTALLKFSQLTPGWGLHVRDVGLVQGNILDILDAELASWRKPH